MSKSCRPGCSTPPVNPVLLIRYKVAKEELVNISGPRKSLFLRSYKNILSIMLNFLLFLIRTTYDKHRVKLSSVSTGPKQFYPHSTK